MCNPGNSETWYIDNPGIFRTLTCLTPHTSGKPSQRFKMECFPKIFKSYNCFSKALYLRSLIRFWIDPSLNKCLLTLCNVLYETYSEHCHIQDPYIFRTQDIFRTLPRHILAYAKYCVTLAHWEPCHIQNIIPVYLGILS